MQTKTSYIIFIKPKAKPIVLPLAENINGHKSGGRTGECSWNLALKWQLHEMANAALYVHKVIWVMKKKAHPDGFTDSQIFGSSEPI